MMPKASRKVTLGGGLGIWGTGFALGAAIILGVRIEK